jgi:hypothetical protein
MQKISLKFLNPFIFFIFCSMAFSFQSKAAEKELLDPYTLSNTAITGEPISALIQLENLRDGYLNSSKKFSYFSVLGTLYSFVGEYEKADKSIDTNHRDYSPQPLKAENLSLVNAKETILKLALNHQVIMLNEAHHIPAHRAFTQQLLKDLYAQGFRYFAAEALGVDPDLKARKFPLLGMTGLYINEPVFGNLIREALKLGYTIVDYEDQNLCEEKEDQPFFCQDQREKEQANNLYQKILKKDPKAKIIVNSGYGHMSETAFAEFTPMGVYFQKITGINPLTIDQETLRPHSESAKENPFYQSIAKLFKWDQPVLVQKTRAKEKAYWLSPGYEETYDLQVLHPITKVRDNRPAWRFFADQKALLINLEPCKKDFPCLVQARQAGEPIESVPVDQIIIRNKDQKTALALSPGKYDLYYRNQTGRILFKREIEQN